LRPSSAVLATDVARTNNEWRMHGTTSESLEPEPKGEGTVWQRKLIRPNRTHQKPDSTQRGETLVNQPGFAGPFGSDDEPRLVLGTAGLFRCRHAGKLTL
jgi:hypothetical protein